MGRGRAQHRSEAGTCSCRQDVGLLLIRSVTGVVLAAHGVQKLFGWFGGGGIEGTAGAMEAMGFEPGRENAIAAGLGETAGGLLFGLGLATPLAGAAGAGAMAAATAVHWNQGLYTRNGGFELPLLLGLTATGLGLTGPGRLSMDHATGHALNRPWQLAAAFAGAAAVTTTVVGRRNRLVAKRAGEAEEARREATAAKNEADEAALRDESD